MLARLGRLTALIPLALAMAVVGATAAGADPVADTAPCNGVTVTDPAGDQLLFPTVVGGLTATATKGPDNTDIRRVWFNERNGVVTANMEITNLSKEYPAESRPNNGVQWAIWFDQGDITHYVKAVSNGTAISYKYGGYTIEDTAVLGEMGDTKGQFLEGPAGRVSIEIPAALGVKAGTALTGVSGRVAFKQKDSENSYSADRAPDAAGDDKSVTIASCPAEATPTPTGSAEETPTPGTPEQPAQPGQPAQQSAPAATPTPTPAAKKPAPKKAKKCKKARGKAKGHAKKGFAKCPKPKKKSQQ